MSNNKVWVDPPSGWKYGFPKLMPVNKGATKEELHAWIIKNGYPRKEIESYGEHFYCQFSEE